MKARLLSTLLLAGLLVMPGLASAAEEPSAATKELRELVTKIQTKLKAGDRTEAKLADELKEFDALLAKHKDEKTDDVAQILMMKAQLYSQVLGNEEKGQELFEQLKKDFPDSKPVARLKKQEEAEKTRSGLVAGAKFPDFDEKDLLGKPFNLAAYKGKVVLVDFWATWCGPCVGELPNVQAAYEKHHAAGFEIVGISLDSDKAKLEKFIESKKMPWQQYFDGKGWENKLAGKYGVNSIPATYLLDGEGKIIAKNLRGEALEAAVAKALAK
jgi:peroxiredoxin